MKISKADQSAEKETGRLEAFSDGVFSIAMTLLVLELKVPDKPDTVTAGALCAALGRQWPSYFAFVTSFATVLIMWVNHHGIFRHIRRTSGLLMFTNGFLLLLVTAVPFPTALIAAYLKSPAASTACAVYSGLFVLIAAAYAMVLWTALRGNLLATDTAPEISRRLRDCLFVGMPLYFIAALAAPFSPGICLGICTVLWIFWAFVAIRY